LSSGKSVRNIFTLKNNTIQAIISKMLLKSHGDRLQINKMKI